MIALIAFYLFATLTIAPAVAVIDQWGDITDVHAAGPDHAFAAVSEVVSWARFLAVQCPECEGEAY